MIEKNISIQYRVHHNDHQLDKLQIQLIESAMQAASLAYAPYSKFQVGAAILLENHNIMTGCNQENASYPCGVCAERAVLYSYGNLATKPAILKMAISLFSNTHPELDSPAPCGLCRQVMAEFEIQNGNNIELLLGNLKDSVNVFSSLRALLPFHFHSGFLEIQ